MKLCSSCSQFSLHDLPRLPDRTCSLVLSDLEAGARGYCAFCSFLCSQLQQNLLGFETHPSKTWVRLKSHPHNRQSRKNSDGGRNIELQLHELELYLADTQFETKTEHRSEGIFLGLAANADSPAARNGDIVGRYYGDEPGSDEHIASILEWVSTCLNHDRCCRTASGASQFDARDVPLPNRCIEITQKNIYLRETVGLRGSYVALSHRWNRETDHYKTTTGNVDERKSGRGFGALPQSFQDAMNLTQRLGVRYIWIDSLCIIQSGDSGADWRREAGMMSRYYQQSLLTISVISESPMQSLLDIRQSGPFQSLLRMPYKDKAEVHKGWYYIYKPHERSLPSFVANIRNSELLHRGWIFQEWFLSRRVIFCTPSQLFFECQTELPMNERQQRMMLDIKDDLAVRIRENMQKSTDFGTWYDIVELYSKTHLTRPDTDRLIAISGIATEFRENIKAESKPKSQTKLYLQYVSGLWLEDLHHGLLWQTRTSEAKACGCGAPSWSWASQQGEVKWLPRRSTPKWLPKRLSYQTKCEIRISGLIDCWAQHHLEAELREWNEVESHTSLSLADTTGIDPFNTTSITAAIVLEGRMTSTLVRSFLWPSEDASLKLVPVDTLNTLARETDIDIHIAEGDESWKNDPKCQYASDWLLVCAPSSPAVIGGWALLDNTSYHKQLNGYEGVMLLAFHIATRKGVGKVGPSGDKLGKAKSIARNVSEVLFLEPQEGDRYRRVGVGRIFDGQIIANFMESDMVKIELI